MRICVPTATDDGMDAMVYPHFGSAPFFSVLDTTSGTVEGSPNAGRQHEHGHCNPVASLADVDLDAVVVQGMGRNALARLGEAGIPVYVAAGKTVRDIWFQARGGSLRPLDPGGACGGHSHGGSCRHHHHIQG